jgi:predicted aconitase
MQLTDEERALLHGEGGQAVRKAMEILVALGRIYGADRLLPVRSVQVSGVSFHNLGDAGLEWLEQIAVDGRVRALTTLNPAGMDLQDWQRQGIPAEFAELQLRLVGAYQEMGIAPTCTCTPYLIGNLPTLGEHIAWAESSAVAFANSVLGARTNREGGPSALAAALAGRTPRYGLHLDENRIPTLEVTVDSVLSNTADWGALGHVVGKLGQGRVAVLRLEQRPRLAELKSLGAALVTFGGSPLFYVQGLSPASPAPPRIEQRLRIGRQELSAALHGLDDGSEAVGLVCLGCPHCSLQELAQIADLLGGRQLQTEMWVCTARPIAEAARQLGLLDRFAASGAKLVCDTCFAVAPLGRPGMTIATDSVKGCYYGRGHNRLRVHLGSPERCVAAACTGRWQ